MSDKAIIVEEHFWITATTFGLNAFLVSEASALGEIESRAISTIVSVFALFLIVHRSAAHADKIEDQLPADIRSKPQRDRTWFDKLRETGCHWRIVFRHVPFVICECSGALFYSLLVVLSCVGVWLTNGQPQPGLQP